MCEIDQERRNELRNEDKEFYASQAEPKDEETESLNRYYLSTRGV